MEDTVSYTNFSREVWQQFKEDQRAGPIHMLNLIRLREKAAYPDDRDFSGVEAYKTYSELSAPIYQGFGGRIVWRGEFELTLIGPSNEGWDIAFVAEYPSVQSFLEMMRNPRYLEAVQHRQAAVLDSRLVRFSAAVLGVGFYG